MANQNGTKKLAKALLAGTCLAGAASASTINEGVIPASSDFTNAVFTVPLNDEFAPPVKTVIGAVGSTDSNDFFEFIDLLPSSAFSLSYSLFASAGFSYPVSVYEDSGFSQIAGATPSSLTGETVSGTLSGTVPANGDLIVGVHSVEAPGFTIHWSTTLTATAAVPEPGTLPLAGLGLAGALAWRRRRKQ